MDPNSGNNVATDSTLSAVRTILSALVGWAAGAGYLPTDQASSIVTGIMLLLPVAWSVVENFRREKVTQVRIAAAVAAAPDSATTQGAKP